MQHLSSHLEECLNSLKNSTLVIKIGSAVLANEENQLDFAVIDELARQVSQLQQQGLRPCLVSSGAIMAGVGVMGLKGKPRKLEKKQALAAIGQVHLMSRWRKSMMEHGLKVAQILLTHEGIAYREGFNNARATLEELLREGVIPIINENDTISTREIRFGENDQLAVAVANLVEAKGVIFLSAAPGLLDFDHKDQRLIREVETIDEGILAKAKGGNSMGSGGMGSKLMALKRLTEAGKAAWLANGKSKNILCNILKGEGDFSYFRGSSKRITSKNQWMLHHLSPRGTLHVDAGAFRALTRSGASLLSPGIRQSEGTWELGELLEVCFEGKSFARGMARMSSAQLKKVLGLKATDAKTRVGKDEPGFVIHRNDIVLHSLDETVQS